MIRHTPYIVSGLMALLLAAYAPSALATEDAFVVASVEGSRDRFMSLQPVRDGVVRVDNGLTKQRAPLRSDRDALQKGFMRIDRTAARPIPTFKSRNVATSNNEQGVMVHRVTPAVASRTAIPGDSDITDLFSAPETSSFREALQGGGMGGGVRHAWPVAKNVQQKFTSAYGMRKDPFHGRPAFHGGIDIAAAPGTPVLASAEGVVSKVAVGKGLGKYVAVQHRDGTESYYGHMRAQNVRIGQRVMQGQKVGELGSTGRSTGPHLDYRIKKNGQTFNPMTVLVAPRTNVAVR